MKPAKQKQEKTQQQQNTESKTNSDKFEEQATLKIP